MQTVSSHWALPEHDRRTVRDLVENLEIPWIVANILYARGFDSTAEAERFLNPELQPLTDPFSLTDMDVAVRRIARARESNEHVRVYGDYDVDGVAATAVMVRALMTFGLGRCSYQIPHRIADGYGLGTEAVDRAHRDNVDLIVTVDNGIASHGAVHRARELGIDVVITDHHSLPEELPAAFVVINPKRGEDSQHPFYHACGAAVAFKLATALNGRESDLDLVALATVADVVPLRGENRTLVALGLDQLRRDSSPGIAALTRKAGLDSKALLAETIAFQLGPRINAAGRLGDSESALLLLLANSRKEAKPHAETLDGHNLTRRAIEKEIIEELDPQSARLVEDDRRSLVFSKRGWPPGLSGTVASRLQNRYWVPVVIIAVDQDGLGRASARSIPEFDLFQAFEACKDLLVRYGGHRAAAGMTIREENIPLFDEAFEALATESICGEERVHELAIDANVALSEIDGSLLKDLERLEPCGQGNPAPVFVTLGVDIVPGSLRRLAGGHLRLNVQEGPCMFPAIGFSMADRIDIVSDGQHIDIAFTPKFNTWKGRTTIQLQLLDIRIA